MKSPLLALTFGAALLTLTSNARADWNFFKDGTEGSTSSRKTPQFLPTAAIAVGIDPGKNAEVYGNFLLGVSHYPMNNAWSPFYSAALEMDLRSTRDAVGNTSTVPIFGPQLRGGISFFPDNNGYLSFFNAYGLVSYRAPSAFEGHTFRVGVGISSPGVGVTLLTARLALPWMFEGTLDITDLGVRPSVRVGFSY